MEMHSHQVRVTSPGGSLVKKGQEKKFGSPHQLKSPSHPNTNGKAHTSPSYHKVKMTNGGTNGSSSASFSTNSNSVVCLPLVSEGLKLVWTQSDQTKELDAIPELVQAFNVFPYPTSQEVSTLAHVCGLPLDKVKVWFMVQRIKYGISWASEDIEETRCKLAGPERMSESVHEESKKRKKSECDDLVEVGQKDHTEDSMNCSSRKKQKRDPQELVKVSPSATPHSPQQNSDFNSHHVDNPATTPSTASPSSLDSSLGCQQKQGRYKKSKAQLTALRKSFLQENWPDETELRRLQEETGLSRNEIRKWFSDSRYQLRTGRGMPGLTSGVSQGEHPPESPQLQPLSLVTEKQQSSVSPKGGARNKRAQKSSSRNSHFFQIFLSNTLEAFGEGEVEQIKTEVAKEEDDLQHNDEEVGSEHESEAHEAEALSEASVSTSSSLCITPQSSSSLKKSPHVAKASGRVRKSKEQLDILKEYFLRSPWPKSEEYTQLVERTALPRADIIQWFGDTRYAVKNGQLRWVRGIVRDHILAEIALQQNGSGGGDASSSTGTPKSEGNRKRKSQSNSSSKVPKSTSNSSDMHPLELYHRQTGALQEKDLDALCRKSKMSYQQVRDWFASKDSETHNGTDD
ncbi:homeobox and leucine zipper encoding a [Colossoma macropomum]|uniref:homeobox and leucine zipper encoding a n=1 Tax=Colossoma macropomum TaxID=42526 RepID=UPI001863EC32|nr:homeobox and leucine zipper encoding a [Colossoma macropomum]XP_036453005.1 homeobox and leucine zipper encoding a [Colossoma macropomum]